MSLAGLPSRILCRPQGGRYLVLALIVLGPVVGIALARTGWRPPPRRDLPAGIVSGTVRVEAELVDIATRGPGQLREVLVAEGDPIHPGQILARLDRAGLDASLARARAEVARMETARRQSAARVHPQEERLEGSARSWAWALPWAEGCSVGLRKGGRGTARSRLQALEERIRAANAEVDRLRILADATTLTSPVQGLVHSRLAGPGDVLAAGGKALSVLDLDRIYMESFLPARLAGRVQVGSEARVLLDSDPDVPIPARVAYVSPTAQLPPRLGEPPLFRVKAALPRSYLREHTSQLGNGLRGLAYFRLDATRPWPVELQGPSPVSSR